VTTLSLFQRDPVSEVDSTDAQNTPRELALALGVFGIDVCTNPRSHIRSFKTFMLEHGQDGLAEPWTLSPGGPAASVWCNGPYSDPLPWCERLARHTGPWAALWKLDTTTRWFDVLMRACDAWACFRDRITFERPGNCGTANFSSVLVWGGGWVPPLELAPYLWPSSNGVR